MKRFVLICVSLTFCATAFPRESQLHKATNVLNEIRSTPDKGIPQDSLGKAVNVGIVPSQVKFAFELAALLDAVCWRAARAGAASGLPPMFAMGGGEATDMVFLVMNPNGMKELVQDSVRLGAELSVVAGPVGRSANGATDIQLHAEILSYSRSSG